MRWGVPPAAWRDPAETQAADPIENVSKILDIPPDRFDNSPGAAPILMRDGEWLVPESERPLDRGKPR